MKLQKATRKRAKIRLCLQGPSGAGKTYSALLIAHGLCSDWSKICLIDSENHSGELYSHLGSYNTISISEPFTPEKYSEAISLCEKHQMEVIIIDSITHEWDGVGGILEIHNSMPGNSFTNWGKVLPRHNHFVQSILQSNAHVIATVRSKQDYVINERNGKMVPEKVGMKSIQKDGLEYEFTLVFELNIHQQAIATKDRTSLFLKKPPLVLTPDVGKQLLTWCIQPDTNNEQPTSDTLSKLILAADSLDELTSLYKNHPNEQTSHLDLFIERKQQLQEVFTNQSSKPFNNYKNGFNTHA